MSGLKSIISPITSILGLTAKKQEVESPAVMPDSDDEAVKAARRRQIAEVQARSGRASTILSQTDQLGG